MGLLGGSWVVTSGVVSPLIWVIFIVALLITPPIPTHEPPSRHSQRSELLKESLAEIRPGFCLPKALSFCCNALCNATFGERVPAKEGAVHRRKAKDATSKSKAERGALAILAAKSAKVADSHSTTLGPTTARMR